MYLSWVVICVVRSLCCLDRDILFVTMCEAFISPFCRVCVSLEPLDHLETNLALCFLIFIFSFKLVVYTHFTSILVLSVGRSANFYVWFFPMESISWFVASTQCFSLTTSWKWHGWDERNENILCWWNSCSCSYIFDKIHPYLLAIIINECKKIKTTTNGLCLHWATYVCIYEL